MSEIVSSKFRNRFFTAPSSVAQVVFGTLLAYILLTFYYFFFTSIDFRYMGFIREANIFKSVLAFSSLMALLATSIQIQRKSDLLFSLFILLIYFFYLPVSILFSISDMSFFPWMATLFFLMVVAMSAFFRFPVSPLIVSQKVQKWLMMLLPVAVLVPVIYRFGAGINWNVLLLRDVYETREIFSTNLTGVYAYLYNLAVKLIIPVTLLFFLSKRNYVLAGILIAALFYLYLISGNKIVYFSTFILLFFYYVGRSMQEKTLFFLLLTVLIVPTAAILDNVYLDEPLIGGTFLNRFLFIPGLLTQWYFDFFEGNPFYFAESSFFNRIFDSPYDMPVGFLLTKIYWNQPLVYANNGLVSDGFMNLGFPGVVLFAMVICILFSLFNRMNLSRSYYGVYFMYLYLFLSAPLLMSFVTGGLLIFIGLGLTTLHADLTPTNRIR